MKALRRMLCIAATAIGLVGVADPALAQMQLGTNFWRTDWGSNGWREYYAEGVNWSNTSNPWRQTFLDEMAAAKYKVIRYMDWVPTNGSSVTTWSQRRSKTADHYSGPEVAYEWQIDLCNRLDMDIWVNIPHAANADYSYQLANLLKNNLEADRKIYVEWSNEVWNYSFGQNTWIRNGGRISGMPNDVVVNGTTYYGDGDQIWNHYVHYSCRTFNEFERVFGKNSSRLVKVLGGQLGYEPWGGATTSPMANYHLAALKNGTINPNGVTINAYAVAPYWWGDSVSAMRTSLDTLKKWLGYHKNSLANTTLNTSGATLICYEGGADGNVAVNEDAGQYQLYIDALNAMKEYCQGVFVHYTHVGADGSHYWGLKKFTGQAESQAHKWRGAMKWVADNGGSTPPPPPPSSPPPPPPPPSNGGTGTGLKGEYFNNKTVTGTAVLTRTDTTVDFSWSGSPGTGVNADNFSVKWTGQVEAPGTGTYTFQTVSDDGIRLSVNGSQIINNWTDHGPTTDTSAGVSLTGGTKYNITLEFYENGGGAEARLRWITPGSSSAVAIPQGRLYPANGGTTPPPPPPPAGQPLANGTYKVVSRHSAKAMDVAAWGTTNGSQVHQWTYGGGANQKWTFEYQGDGHYEIKPTHTTGKNLDVASGSSANGTKIQIWDDANNDAQRFKLEAVTGGYWRITPKVATGSCLDVAGVSTADGALIHLWTWGGANNQQWTISAP